MNKTQPLTRKGRLHQFAFAVGSVLGSILSMNRPKGPEGHTNVTATGKAVQDAEAVDKLMATANPEPRSFRPKLSGLEIRAVRKRSRVYPSNSRLRSKYLPHQGGRQYHDTAL